MKNLDLIIILIMILTLLFAISYYYIQTTNECVSSPFVYGAKQYSEKYHGQMYGRFYIYSGTSSIIIGFNATGQELVD